MMDALLPPAVVTCEAWATDELEGELLPDERAHVARAVPKRVEEFRRGRACARRALFVLGAPHVPIGVTATRAPRWPDGTVGSITHCDGFCAAAVGSSSEVLAVGIDAEPDRPLPDGIFDRISTDRERRWARTAVSTIACDTLVFSAKEAVYKVWSPLTNEWLGFCDAEVEVDLAANAFVATISRNPTLDVPTLLHGRFGVQRGVIATAIVVAAPSASRRGTVRPFAG